MNFHHVSDEFYLFKKEVEMQPRTTFSQELLINYCGRDLKTILHNKLSKGEKSNYDAGIILIKI